MEKQKLGDNLERRDPKNPSSSSTHPSSSENHTAIQENHHPLPENHRSIPSSLRQDFFWHGQSGNHRLPTQPSPENHRQAPGNHLSIPRSRRDSFPSALAQPSNHPSPENHPNIPRSRREIYPSMLPMPESNIPNLDHYRSMNHITVSPNPNVVPVNPSFRDFVRDPSFLGDEFSCMTLSDDQSSLRSPAVNSSSLLWNHSIGRELFTNLYPQSQHNITEMDLQRLRVQYAVSGMNPQSYNHLPLPRDEAARFDLINHSTNNGGNGGFGDYGGLPNNGVSYRILPNNGGNGFSTYEWQNHGGNGFAQGILPNNGGNGLSYEWQNHGGNGFAQGILPNNGGNTSFALPNNGGNGYDYEAQNYGGNGLSNDGFAHGLPNNEGDALRHGVSRNVNNRNNNSLVLDSGFQQRRRSMNGFETENSQAVYDNSPLYRSRQCQLSQWGSVVSLEELKGRVLEMAKNQQGCRWLQKKFEEGNPDDIQMIFLEVKDYVTDLMKDNFGNYFMQKFFEVCNEQQITQILVSVIRNECQFRTICLDTHGYGGDSILC
ncbi:uncharacterized protein LOC132301332 [Cornus florida]|uniref:uncharacterized protein LOC132301332 n=1 Tax=Cornus florida TaxID=4283 RepID=UPI00289BB883|nr:uncharacterized protein LOC132301332 [Cornus florida]